MLFVVPPQRQDRVREALNDLVEVAVSHEVHGSQVIVPFTT